MKRSFEVNDKVRSTIGPEKTGTVVTAPDSMGLCYVLWYGEAQPRLEQASVLAKPFKISGSTRW